MMNASTGTDAPPPAINLILIDEDEAARRSLAKRLGAEPGVRVVAWVADSRAAMSFLSRVRADVALIVVGLNERNDLATVRTLRALWPHMGIALLTSRVHSSLVGRARFHGINAMAMTQERFSMVRRAIFAAAHGRFWYSPALVGRTVDTGVRCARPSRTPKHVATLTPRENEVLAHLALGHSVKETARHLGLARSTVDNHKTHIMKKINVHSLAELARYAIRMGVVES